MAKVTISSNAALTSLTMDGAITLSEGLEVSFNDALPSFSIGNLELVPQSLSISQNTALTGFSLAKLKEVKGDLLVDKNPALNSLSGLGELSSVGSFVLEENNSLSNLTGLVKLTSVGGDLRLVLNETLNDISGLSALTGEIGGNLEVNGSEQLTSLAGLGEVTSVKGYLYVVSTGIIDLSGLEKIQGIGTDLNISFNGNLTSIAQLGGDDPSMALSRINGNLSLLGNEKLASLDGLQSLASIGGYLQFVNLESIVNLDELAALTTVGGFFELNDNNTLGRISGIPLSQVDGEFRVMQNACLLQSDVNTYSQGITVNSNMFVIADNADERDVSCPDPGLDPTPAE